MAQYQMPAYEFAAGPAVMIGVRAPYGHEIGEDGQEDSDDASAKGGDEKPLPTLAQQIKEAQIGQVAHTQAHDLPRHENLAQHIEERKDDGPVERVGPPRA